VVLWGKRYTPTYKRGGGEGRVTTGGEGGRRLLEGREGVM
jgi:hypothetical protein